MVSRVADRWQYYTAQKNVVIVHRFVFNKLRDKTYLKLSFDSTSYYGEPIIWPHTFNVKLRSSVSLLSE